MKILRQTVLSVAALAALLALPPGLRAEDKIRLKSGQVVRGRIVAETEASVTIEIEEIGRVSYSRGQIATIVRDKPPAAPDTAGAPVKADAPTGPAQPVRPAETAPPAVAHSPLIPDPVPQGPMKDLVVRVGPGGVPRRLPPVGLMPSRDFDFYLRRVAVPLRKKPDQLSSDERKKAVDLAIRDELLFQGALADGILKDDYCRSYVIGVFRSARTRLTVDPQAIPEGELQAYYKEHPEEFMSPSRVLLEGTDQRPVRSEADLLGALREAREKPDGVAWKGAAWFKADDNLPAEFLAAALKLKTGEIALLKAPGGWNLFRAKEREEPVLQPFDAGKVRFAMVGKKVRENELSLSSEVRREGGAGSEEETLLRQALEAGAAREAQVFLRIVNTWLSQQKLPPDPEKVPSAVLDDLRRRFPVTILIED